MLVGKFLHCLKYIYIYGKFLHCLKYIYIYVSYCSASSNLENVLKERTF